MRIKITKNVDSFRFVIRRFFNLHTEKHWWLVNLYLYTLQIEL